MKTDINTITKRLNIGFCTSKTLASYVVIYKALNIDKELALMSMNELARRRKLGEIFDYESFIDEEIAKMPKMRNINLPELGRRVIGKNFKRILG